MNRTILIFGLIAGAICSGIMVVLGATYDPDKPMDFSNEWLGWTFLILGLSVTFFGVRTYRENHPERASFKRLFFAGLGITVVASIMYILAWEIVYHKFMPDFMDKYTDAMIERTKQAGKYDAAAQEEMLRMRDLYKNNVLVRMGFTLLEIFPVGILVSLISAAVLRRKNTEPFVEETAMPIS